MGKKAMNHEEKIKNVFIRDIEKHLYKYYWEKLGLRDWKARVNDRISEVPRNEKILKTLESFIGSLRGKRILVVGSGWGGACVAAKKLGAHEVIGIDIDNEANKIANQRMYLEGYTRCCLLGAAEDLPFTDNQFDYVHCFTVLEHVKDLKRCLSEMLRVTNKGGFTFIHGPSYLRPVERHYKIPYVPLMPKRLAKIYLKLLDRPPDFIDSINYIWPGRVKKLLGEIENIEVRDIADEYKRRFNCFRDYGENVSPLIVGPMTIQRKSTGVLLGKIASRLITNFYKAWDFAFGTREIYLVIRRS